MGIPDQYCQGCQALHPHEAGENTVTCTGCGLVTEVSPDLIQLVTSPPVEGVAFCAWCKETKAADHVCPAGAVGCTERAPEETPCGGCGACIAAMTADLARRAEFEHGSPSDLYTP
ncbi:hypothetical protein [Nonomuraea sp. NPDC049400]|uniref:hypothetical protein n=1 Tax=Nonomuraea sp. NPDC049400 TaxID=3364352 RepID=UPI0037B67428